MRILFVCLGNICRSPTAEAAVAEALDAAGIADRVELDSAGTGGWHVGDPPDRRMAEMAAREGLHLDGAARKFDPSDFERFDLICAMDRSNLHAVMEQARDEGDRKKVRLFRDFDPAGDGDEIPDPYYGGTEGFRRVVEISRRAARGLVDEVSRQLR